MDLVLLSFSVCVMMVCLPGPAQLSSSVKKKSCPCPEIPPWNLTKNPQITCFQIGNRFRYQCVDGYLRRVGTSNLIKCELIGGAPNWTKPTLECIPDPKITTTTTQRTVTTVKAATSTTQMMQQSTAPAEGKITEATTHETMNQTAAKTETLKSSTPSPRVANNSISPAISHTEPLKTTTVATVSTLVIVCSLGIIFLLYRRKSKRRILVPTEDKLENVKCTNLGPPGVETL